MANAGDHAVIDVETLASNIERELSGNLVMPPRCSIFKIPAILLRHNKNAYTPNAFSFGPFHHDNDQLKPTKKIKQKSLPVLVSRLLKPNILPDSQLIKNITKAISDEFVEMLVLDGCFIIELFRKKAYPDLVEKNDPVFAMSCLVQFLYHDLILLENQIPWLFLEILFEMTKISSIDIKPLVELAIDFLS